MLQNPTPARWKVILHNSTKTWNCTKHPFYFFVRLFVLFQLQFFSTNAPSTTHTHTHTYPYTLCRLIVVTFPVCALRPSLLVHARHTPRKYLRPLASPSSSLSWLQLVVVQLSSNRRVFGARVIFKVVNWVWTCKGDMCTWCVLATV